MIKCEIITIGNIVLRGRINWFYITLRFVATENMTADKIADFLDRISLRISKRTFVVLDNASIYRYRLMRDLRHIWEKHALFLVFISPYSSHLINITETLWHILKGKWLKPVGYLFTDALLYAANRVLATIRPRIKINFAYVA